MRSITNFSSTISPILLVGVVASTLGVVAVSIRAFESDEAKRRRAELKRQRELREVAARISTYGSTVHQQFPTGDVVVSERDLAERLRKRTDIVVDALNLLLKEQKAHRFSLSDC